MTLLNPFLGFPQTQGWTDGSHAQNPAIDYATPVGVEFVAPADGIYRRLATNLSRTDGTAAGHLGELLIVGGEWDGYRIRFAHNDRHRAAHGQDVRRGVTVLAVTGNTGYVRPRPTADNPHAGAHQHTYGLTPDGRRWNWTLHASAPSVAFNPEENDMYTDDDRERDAATAAAVTRLEQKTDRLARIIGGTDGGPNLLDYLRPVKSAVERLTLVLGFSVKGGKVTGGNVADRLRRLEERRRSDE